MAKIKINKLPKGFKLVDGKVVEDKFMRDGGDLQTGDQANYGLVTTPQEYYGNTNFNNTDDKSVRYSLSSVPRDNANIEAEGGETVLTDLTNDGTFGLYDIKGPRHSKGGVPMFLPEQSFIYSDTDKMKFTKDELAEFGISTKKKMSPAKLSKKYQLNEYYAHMESPYADKIQATTAELMLKKNMMNLSKVAFGQESKKKFEDGVPLASHPYLVQQGIDPIEFTAKMEEITMQEAQMKAMAAMPPEQQEQMLQMQQMMAQMEQQQAPQQGQQPVDQEMAMQEQAMARFGGERRLKKAQFGLDTDYFNTEKNSTQTTNPVDFNALLSQILPSVLNNETYSELVQQVKDAYDANGQDGLNQVLTQIKDKYIGQKEVITDSVQEEEEVVTNDTTNPVIKNKNPKNKKSNNVAFDQSIQDRYTNDWGITFNDNGVGSTLYSDVQGYQDNGLFGGAGENMEGWKEANADYPGMETLLSSLPEYGRKKNPEVEKYQKWFNEVSIPQQVAAMRAERERVGKEFTDEDEANATSALLKDYGFKKGKGTGYDGLMGTWTSSRRPFTFKDEVIEKEVIEEADPIETIVPKEYSAPDPEWWIQDQNNLTALGQIDDNLYLPWAPDAKKINVAPTFDDWRAQVNSNNATANTMANALGAAGGPQAVAGSNIQGQTLDANAKAINRVNSNNVNIANQSSAMQAQYDDRVNMENARRQTKVYDDTQKTLQASDNFRNWRVGENVKLQNAALTNRANTYNLNSTYDTFATDPTTGGMVGMTNPRGLEKVGNPADQMQAYYDKVADYEKQTGRQMPDALVKALYPGAPNQSYGNQYQQELAKNQATIGRQSAAKGKEIKGRAFPFYTGKMGG
jgi:hypothetical protein